MHCRSPLVALHTKGKRVMITDNTINININTQICNYVIIRYDGFTIRNTLVYLDNCSNRALT